MNIKVEINSNDIKYIVAKKISEVIGQCVEPDNFTVLVKSKQNYKSEWEPAEFKVVYEKNTLDTYD